jgi:hypothetical protein
MVWCVGRETMLFYYDGHNMIAEGSVSGSTVSFQAWYVRGYQLLSMKNGTNETGYYVLNECGDVVNINNKDRSLLNMYENNIWGNPVTTDEANEYGNPLKPEFVGGCSGSNSIRRNWGWSIFSWSISREPAVGGYLRSFLASKAEQALSGEKIDKNKTIIEGAKGALGRGLSLALRKN